MAISVLATSYGTAGVTSPSIDSTGADLLIGPVYLCSGPSTTTDDTFSNGPYTKLTLAEATSTSYGTYQGYKLAPTVGSGHVATNSQAFARQALIAVSGADASPLDGSSQQGSVSGSTSISPGSLTPSVDGCLIVITMNAAGGGAIAVPAGFTTIHNETNTAACAYMIQGTAAAINPTWTWANSVGGCCSMTVWKPAAGGGGGGGQPPRSAFINRLRRAA